MGAFKDSFNDRISAAANAKKAAAERFRAKPGPDDPAVLKRQAERQAISEARQVRAAKRELERQAELVRLAAEESARAAEQAIRDAEEAERAAAAIALAAEQAAREAALEVERKAARDARYAARKKRR